MDDDSSKDEGTRFSTAKIVPWGVVMPTVVDPSYEMSANGEDRERRSTDLDSLHGIFDLNMLSVMQRHPNLSPNTLKEPSLRKRESVLAEVIIKDAFSPPGRKY